MIRFDRSPRSIVGVCACGARDVFATPAAADRWAVDHVFAAHPDPSRDRTRTVTAARVRRHRDTP